MDQNEMYLAPRATVLREGASADLGTIARGLGILDGRVLIVVDPFLADDPALTALRASFEGGSFTSATFSPPIGEPDEAALSAAVGAAASIGATLIVAMGGGSAIDLAKAAAMIVANREPFALVLERIAASNAKGALPVIAVPTTAGTGAEATKVSVIKSQGKKKVLAHNSMVPVAAVLDPDLLRTLPPSVAASTGIDALSHAIESYLSTNASYLTRHSSMRGMELMSRYLPQVVDDPADATARRATMYGAYLGGLGLNAGVILGHSIAYTIANRSSLPHGITCGIALPYAIAYSARESAERLGELPSYLDGCRPGGAEEIVTWLEALNRRFDLPVSLSALGISADEAQGMADECIALYPRPTNPRPLETGALRNLFAQLHAGERPAITNEASSVQGEKE